MHSKTLEKYILKISDEERLSKEEELEVSTSAVNGDAGSMETLIKSHLKLVIYIAKQYKSSLHEIEDLISEGNHGLMIAAERFDPSKGARFSTFASFYIKSKIREFIFKKNKTINIPLGAINKYFKIKRAEKDLRESLERDPTNKEISDKIGIGESQVMNLRRVACDCRSIDEIVAGPDGEGVPIGELIADPSQDFISKHAHGEKISSLIEHIEHLGDRDKRIIKSRFGIDDCEIKTLDELGDEFNISKERVRQLQESCLSKLKLSMDSGTLHTGKDTNLILSETEKRKKLKKNAHDIKAPSQRLKKSKEQEKYWRSLKGERFNPQVL